jgi:putative Ca2+/H+ antiporter (TMEM165/GDT1 family)
MDFVPVVSTFLLIFVGEFGDKTQLTVISLSCSRKVKHVFLGAMLAFLAVDGVSAFLGGPLLALLPVSFVRVVAGVVFIFFGILPLIPRKGKDSGVQKTRGFTMFGCFSMVALMELGDKTQLITMTLAAQNPPLLVFAGAMLAFVLLTGFAVLVGAKLGSRIPTKWLKIGTSILFIALGSLSIIGAWLGIYLL